MRVRNTLLALAAVFGLMGSLSCSAFAQAQPLPALEVSNLTRIDDGNLILFKQASPDSTLEEVTEQFDGPVILVKCYSVDSCLKARQIMEPLAHDDVVQEAFYTVIIEAFDSGKPTTSHIQGIVYMFALPGCGMDMGGPEYTSTGLLADALSWYRGILKDCPAK